MMSRDNMECFRVIMEVFFYFLAESKPPLDALQTTSGGYITLEARGGQ